MAQLADADEKREFLASLGLEEPGLARVIRAGYALLHLVTFFTVGPKEAHAWTVEQGTKAPQAAGKVHTDFEKGFIRAETIAYADFAAYGGEQGARDAGRMRLEGADYVVQDGDVDALPVQSVNRVMPASTAKLAPGGGSGLRTARHGSTSPVQRLRAAQNGHLGQTPPSG